MNQEPKISDVLEAIGIFSNVVEKRFDGLEQRLGTVESTMATKEEMRQIEHKVDILITAVDNLAKLVKDFRDEHMVLHRRLEVLEN